MPAIMKSAGKPSLVWGNSREGGRSCYRVIKVRQNAERARRLGGVRQDMDQLRPVKCPSAVDTQEQPI